LCEKYEQQTGSGKEALELDTQIIEKRKTY
jgi:hypothetical protein